MRTSALLLTLSLALSLHAQSPYLVKDINTTVGSPVSSMPHNFVVLGNRTLFAASTPATGDELWVTDGTSGVTSLVADIIPGIAESRPFDLIAMGGVVLFRADDGTHGSELWSSDGTPAGTHLVADINPTGSSGPMGGVVWNNRLYFRADDGSHGTELWTSDGTAAGTHMVKDLNPGTPSGIPSLLTVFNGSLYFRTPTAFWKTNGTEAGTVKIVDILPLSLITPVGSKLYFGGKTSESGAEPTISDGTAAGTHMLADLNPGPDSSLPEDFTPLGNKVLFTATDGVHGAELWVTDGTASGTRMIHEFVAGSRGAFDVNPSYLTVFNGRAFFVASDPDHGLELWSTDGTEAGTTLFDDITPGTSGSGPTDLVVLNGRLFFVANGPSQFSAFARRLWVSDGTVAGTHMTGGATEPLVANTTGLALLWPAGGKLYFAGQDVLNGIEPWVTTNGDDVHPIANVAADPAPSSSPSRLTATDNLLFFSAREDQVHYSLWRSDGTLSGTFKLQDTGQRDDPITSLGRLLAFGGLVTDGTLAGTQSYQSFLNRFGGKAQSFSAFPHGSTLFANVTSDDVFTRGFWAASPAPDGTAVRLGSYSANALTDFAGRIALIDNDRILRISDGTPAGTFQIASLPFSGEQPQIVNAEGTLYFLELVDASQERRQLWKSDGTPDGTTMVVEPASHGPSYIAAIKAAGRKVFFVTGGSLWASDGTKDGTIELASIAPPDTIVLNTTGNRVVWTTWTQSGGGILWTSDGTKEGTKQLMTLDAFQTTLTEIDDRVFFGHADADHGNEIWSTDGTAEGTKLYVDLNPGPAGSFPKEFTKIGNLLYVSATTDATGTELWAIPFTDPTISIADTRVTEGDSGTAVAHFTVSLNAAATQNVTMSYTTSDGTATTGQDYNQVSGTLTFAPGEVSKTIDVVVRGDVAPENNETFFVTLSGVNGARAIRSEAAGIIEDDDQLADLTVSPVFTIFSGVNDAAKISNNGPRAATDINVTFTETPGRTRNDCPTCAIRQVANGATATSGLNNSIPPSQTYVSAIVTARQRDPQSANNAAAWTISGNRVIAMDVPYLRVGQTATLTVEPFSGSTPLLSSDPTVASVSQVANNNTATITATKAGTTNITAGNATGYPLQVTVLDAATPMRWPGGVTFFPEDFRDASFGQLNLSIAATGTAPLTGAKATGTIVVTANGQEIGRQQINGNSFVMPVYLPKLGAMPWVITYSGDANFLPQTISATMTVFPGPVTITGALQPTATAGSYRLRVLVNGSPVSPPSGKISVRNESGTELAQVPLVASTSGTSIAETTLTDLQPSATLTINYPGDAFYRFGTQQIRVVASHQHTVRH